MQIILCEEKTEWNKQWTSIAKNISTLDYVQKHVWKSSQYYICIII